MSVKEKELGEKKEGKVLFISFGEGFCTVVKKTAIGEELLGVREKWRRKISKEKASVFALERRRPSSSLQEEGERTATKCEGGRETNFSL